MIKVLKYSFYDLTRSRWTYLYLAFYFLFTLALFGLNRDPSKVVLGLMNVILILCPLIATLFGIMQYYTSREFTQLLLAQPMRRTHIFLGQYLGIAISLSVSLILGVGVPFVIYGLLVSQHIFDFFTLILSGIFLTFIFSGISFFVGLAFENRIKGLGVALLLWLFFAVIYDGLFLLVLINFSDYPLEKLSLGVSIFNPIDLSRILLLLKMDISALMGYTGAVFKKFFGTNTGMLIALITLTLWLILPVIGIRTISLKKDF